MKVDGVDPPLPEVCCQYLIDIFLEIGPVMSSGFGPTPISQSEIAAWQSNAGVRLQPWEARFMRALSSIWITQARDSEDPHCPSPFSELAVARRDLVAAKIDAAFG